MKKLSKQEAIAVTIGVLVVGAFFVLTSGLFFIAPIQEPVPEGAVITTTDIELEYAEQ